MTDQAMIFAAGEGRRMRPLTLNTPKPLLQAGGRSLLSWQLTRLAQLGIQKVVINTGYLGQQIPQALGQGQAWGLQISYSPEVQSLETGGGLLQALPLLAPQPILVVNGDIWCAPLPQLTLTAGKLAHLLLVNNPAHHQQGDFYLDTDQGRLSNLAQPGFKPFTFAGVSLLDPHCLDADHLHAAYGQTFTPGEAFPLAPLLRHLVDQGLASATLHSGDWMDIGTPERLDQLNRLLA